MIPTASGCGFISDKLASPFTDVQNHCFPQGFQGFADFVFSGGVFFCQARKPLFPMVFARFPGMFCFDRLLVHGP